MSLLHMNHFDHVKRVSTNHWVKSMFGSVSFPFTPGAISLLQEVDARCRPQLDSAAEALSAGQAGIR